MPWSYLYIFWSITITLHHSGAEGTLSAGQQQNKNIKDDRSAKKSLDQELVVCLKTLATTKPQPPLLVQQQPAAINDKVSDWMAFSQQYGKRVAEKLKEEDLEDFRFEMERFLHVKLKSYKEDRNSCE